MNIIAKLRKNYLMSRLIPQEFALEKAQVSYAKLEKWLDSQFKPFFKSTQTQLTENYQQLCHVCAQLEVTKQQIQFADVSNAQVHIKKASQDHKDRIISQITAIQAHIQAASELVPLREFYDQLFNRLTDIAQTYKVAKETLFELIPKEMQSLIELHKKINQHYITGVELLEQSVNNVYVSTRGLAQDIIKKRATMYELQVKVQDNKMTIALLDKDSAPLEEKITTIQDDPRYQSETAHHTESSYKQSFYELEYLDVLSKKKQLDAKKQDLYDDISHLEQQITLNNVDADVHLLKERVKKHLAIMLELVE